MAPYARIFVFFLLSKMGSAVAAGDNGSVPLSRGRQLEDVAMKNASSANGDIASRALIEAWHRPPELLVADDCEETNPRDESRTNGDFRQRDMELAEKDSVGYRKKLGHESDAELASFKSISHSHYRDNRGRRRREKLEATTDSNADESGTTPLPQDLHGEKVKDEDGDGSSSASSWRQSNRDGVIRFSAGPPREKYIVPTLKISEGVFIFRFLSAFFGFLHPFNFPTELLRDVIWNTVSVPQLILQSVRVEVGFIVVIILGLMASLVVPAYGFCVSILMVLGKKKSKYESSSSPTPGLLEDEDCGGACECRILMLIMQMLLLLSIFGIGAMVIGNEFANNGAGLTGNGLRAAGRDLSAYLHATHRDLVHVLLDSADQTVSAVDHDLDRVDVLLGEPIQKAIAVETGIDVAFDALGDIVLASTEIADKVSSLSVEGNRAITMATSAKERLRELRRQLDVARDNCAKADRPLCDTIDVSGLDLVIKFEMVSERRLGALITSLSAQNLSDANESGRRHFANVPKMVANQTRDIIDDVREALLAKRSEILKAERTLAKVSRHLSAAVTNSMRNVGDFVRTIDAVEFWRWLLFILIVVLMCTIFSLVSVAICCGCCGAENFGGSLLKTSVVLMCLLAIPLWCLVLVVFAVGGHGEVFLCRPLYDEPEFRVIGKLLDDPGMLYKENNGFLKEIFKDLDDVRIDQPLKNILRECKENRPAYPVFRLNKITDLNIETAYFNWSKLETAKEVLKNRTFNFNLTTPNFQNALNEIMTLTSVNFTDYRMQLNGPITGKDLISLADQLESIANQNSDLSTSSRIETLAARTRRIVINNIQPLEQLRTELVYKLTELELQIQPFQRQLNQSLSHLKTIQYYIDNQGGVIAVKKAQDYINRLTGYLEQYRGHVLEQVNKHIGPCRPIWDIFDSGRALLCRHYIDSLNGFWLGLSFTLVLWIAMAPMALKLRRSFKLVTDRKSGLLLRTISHQNSSENAAISEQSAWSTPGEPPPDNWR